ncbi:uncharacterized protein LOC143185607 [Calliopsis andreniformis]|uniref:uncharacterized protein LOC143185607 n=1 Tax=Calliopsis andreniformis TaxID=337506 RepID=UPI003FCC4BD3
MVCVEAGLDQSPQGESERWCPHRPPGDVTTPRVASFLLTSVACYPANIFVHGQTARNAIPQPPFYLHGADQRAKRAIDPSAGARSARDRRRVGRRADGESANSTVVERVSVANGGNIARLWSQ